MIAIEQKKLGLRLTRTMLIQTITCLCMFLGAQRFLLPDVYTLACVVTFLLGLYCFGYNRPLFNTLFILSIFLSVDQGANSYNETSPLIRYAIYLVGLFVILINYRSSRVKSSYYLLALILWTILTFVNFSTISLDVFRRDLLLVFLLGVIATTSSKSLLKYSIDIQFVAVAMTAFLLSELVNVVLFFDYSVVGYLSYDSTKSLLVAPAFYALSRKNVLSSAVLIAATTYVFFQYGTRMLLLTYILAIVLYLISQLSRGGRIKTLATIVILFTGLIYLLSNIYLFEDFKFVSSITRSIGFSNLLGFLQSMDDVRFAELELFFSRNIFEILFGSGLGSGIQDSQNLLGFVTIYQTAFSAEELNSGLYYGFHDMWVDIGLRFGVLLVLAIYLLVTRGIITQDGKKAFLSMVLFVLVSCAFFSSAGLIIIAYLALSLASESQKKSTMHLIVK